MVPRFSKNSMTSSHVLTQLCLLKNIEDLSQTIIIFGNRAYKRNIIMIHEVGQHLGSIRLVSLFEEKNNSRVLLYPGIKIRKMVGHSMGRTGTTQG